MRTAVCTAAPSVDQYGYSVRTRIVLVRGRGAGSRASSRRASVVTTVLPRCTTVPVHRTGPVSAVIARVKFAFSSSVVQRVPASAADTNAVPIAESSSVVAKPAWTVPIGL